MRTKIIHAASAVLFIWALAGGGCSKKEPQAKPRAYQIVVSQLRLFQEVVPIQERRAALEAKVFSTSSTAAGIWAGYGRSARALIEESDALARHFNEDLAGLDRVYAGPDRAAMIALVRESSAYVASVRDCSARLAYIVERLERMTREPRSWTKRDYDAAVEAYQRSRDELNRKALSFNSALNELRGKGGRS